ncbi:hypothetical protein Leryth_009863 [Lithospermum erythrorhizon]|nr:hypothetical protein Leryth_009863 [Lithospermum erythrorhizon]
MSVAKPSLSGPPNAMGDGNDPFDIFIRQAIGTDNSSVQWVHLVHPVDQPGLPGWPLLTPLRIQPQTCDKCSREFWSPMNYRRHIRMHRRSLNIDKESHKNRDLLAVFWDKLSLEEAKRVVSFDDISLEGVSGSLIAKAWESYLFKPVVLTLPRAYLRDGTILLEIIQAKSSRLPISSQELFSVLDETSEKTFLCAGTAESVQKFIIDRGAEKALEFRNLVASMSLLFEQKLVKAWIADKDAEALRCQKILVEEEEVVQKRQAQMLERKRRRKLRQKEQKARGQSNGEKTDSNAGEKTGSNAISLDTSADFVEGQASAEICIPQFSVDNCGDTLTGFKPCLEQINFSGKENEKFVETHCDYSSDHAGIDSIEFVGSPREWSTNGLYQSTDSTWQVQKSYRKGRVRFYGGQNLPTAKHEALQKQGPANETNDVANSVKGLARMPKIAVDEAGSVTTVQNEVAKIAIDVKSSRTTGQNVVAEIATDVESSSTTLPNVVSKGEIDIESSRTSSQNIVASHIDMSNSKLLIGSISVPVRNSIAEQHVSQGALVDSSEECASPEKINISQESDSILEGQDPTIAMSKEVCVHENVPVPKGNQNCEENDRLEEVEDHQTVTFPQSTAAETNGSISNNKNSYRKTSVPPEGSVFSRFDVKTFLAQRWKDAIASDHVKLVLSPEPSFVDDGRQDCSLLDQTSDCCQYNKFGDVETPVAGIAPHVSFIKENSEGKFKKKTKKGATRTK